MPKKSIHVLVAIGGSIADGAPDLAADTIYAGADIVTISDAQPTAEALAVKDGRILAVGARSAIEASYKGEDTTLVELGGKTLPPGFLDPHSHYFSSLCVANQVNVFAPASGPGKDIPSIAVAKIPNVAAEPKPEVSLLDMNLVGPVIPIRPYTHADHYRQVYFDTNEAIVPTARESGWPVPTPSQIIRQA